MIQLVNIHKSYNLGKQTVHAVNGVSLTIERGEIFGVIGYSGAGKSTLIRCINLLERPTQGQVLINGQELTGMPAGQLRLARQKIGMIFQQFNLMAARTVADNVAFPLEIAGFRREEINQRVRELLDLVGLSDKAEAYPAQLSGGQKQRVGIARALANHPDVLLCDEATSALDPRTTQSILDLLREINQRLGLTIVLVTHEMPVVQSICQRVAVMENGHVVESGKVKELFRSPQSAAAKQFLSHAVLNPVRNEALIDHLEDVADV